MTDLIVLNGGSSSGKSSIARCLQQLLLPSPWLSWSIDDLVDAMPPALSGDGDGTGAGIEFGAQGQVAVGEAFSAAELAWFSGIAAMVGAGARIILDDVFLGGVASQDRLRGRLAGLDALWVGVRCAPEIAAAREAARGDRAIGMAALQAEQVHHGVLYDLEVDAGSAGTLECARMIADAAGSG